MPGRSARLVQADYDRAANALCKCGLTPEIVFDLDNCTVTVKAAAQDDKGKGSNWKLGAADRV